MECMFEKCEISHDSESDDSGSEDSSQDSNCILVACFPGLGTKEICYSMSSNGYDVETFVDEVVRLDSLYQNKERVTFFKIKDGEKVCLRRPQGVKVKMFHMYSCVF